MEYLVPGSLNQPPGAYAIWICVTLLLSSVGARAANPSNISNRGPFSVDAEGGGNLKLYYFGW